jgi:transposase, IS5 family
MQGKKEENSIKSFRRRAVNSRYVSPNQLTLCGFETPFEQKLTSTNRWVLLAKKIPWDKIVREYDELFSSSEGRPPINGRIVMASVIIKHTLNLTDRETIFQIRENVFMQYFLGYSTFTNEEPFSHTLFTELRKRLSLEVMNKINDILILYCDELMKDSKNENSDEPKPPIDNTNNDIEVAKEIPNKGSLLMDATVAPQNITFPTDLKLLNACREKTEQLIDKMHVKKPLEDKPRTYRKIARKDFLTTVKKKRKTHKEIYDANGSQIRYLNRNIKTIDKMLEALEATDYKKHPLKAKDFEYIKTIKLIYEQQNTMHETNTRRIENRIVNLHQPHVRPIVRGKEGKKVEFGSKIQASLVNGFVVIEKLDWENFNEGCYLKESVANYKKRFGYYPEIVHADKIYSTRENRDYLKELKIKFSAKPLGRPSKKEAVSNLVSPGERNPMEGKFGQGKVKYGLDCINAKLKKTSESWIASIAFVLNIVNFTRLAPLRLYIKIKKYYSAILTDFYWSLSLRASPI